MTARHVSPLAGAYNFRDLGGLPAGAGVIRTGRLFRSDTLQAITPDDVRTLVRDLGIELVVDLRVGPEAVQQGRGPLAEAAVCYLNAPLPDLRPGDRPAREQTLLFYLERLASPDPMLPLVIRLIAAAADRPLVLHCAAGKDRTGLVTALLLRLLGVADDDIVADYVATEQNMPRIIDRFRGWPRYRDHMAAVPPEVYQAQAHTMRGFLRALDDHHGGAREWATARGIPTSLLDAFASALLIRR